MQLIVFLVIKKYKLIYNRYLGIHKDVIFLKKDLPYLSLQKREESS